MGGRSGGGRSRATGVGTLARRLEAVIGKEYSKTLLEIAEALAIFEAQLERGEVLDVRTELLQLRRALEKTAADFRS